MPDKLGDWEIVARQTNDPASPLRALIARLLFQVPDASGVGHSSATWTVRHARTGEVRKITALSEKDFSERLAAGVFDQGAG